MRRWIIPAALVVALAAAPGAAANGDPPSDVLPFEDLYLPADPPAAATADALRGAVKRAREAGYPIKVAVIAAEVDLGPYANAFKQPQQYANYLVTELPRHSQTAQGARILVVAPVGAGIAGTTFLPEERRAARTVQVPAGATSTQVTEAATKAVERMAAAAGKPIGGSGGSSGSGGGAIAGVVIGALLLAAALAGIAARRRQQARTRAP
jgi:hypothetical protein